MPNCFQLIDRETGNAATFNAVDERMCKHFNAPINQWNYYLEWYGIVGFKVATGTDLPAQIAAGKSHIAEFPDDEHTRKFLPILEWLHEHYTTDAWVEIGKR